MYRLRNAAKGLVQSGVAVLFSGLTGVVAAGPIDDFLSIQGVTDSNVGASAAAIQRTCGQLAALGGFGLGGSEGELFDRCNELAVTAGEINTSIPATRSLGYDDPNELLSAFQQVNGEEAQSSATLAMAGSANQFATVAGRLAALRGGSGSTSLAMSDTGQFMMSGGGASADQTPFGAWGWFARGGFATGERDRSSGGFLGAENGFDFDQHTIEVGVDHIADKVIWGVVVSYSDYEIEMERVGAGTATNVLDGGETEGESLNLSVYFDYLGDNDIYFNGMAGIGRQKFDMERLFVYDARNTSDPATLPAPVIDQSRRMTASPDGDSWAASLSVGKMINRGAMNIDPHIGLTYNKVVIDRYSERDSGNTTGPGLSAMQLAFDEQDFESLRTNVGVQFSFNRNTSFGSVRPILSAEWIHEFEDDSRTIKAKYALEDQLAGQGSFISGFDGCVSCFKLRSDEPDSDFFVLGAGIALTTAGGLQGFAMLESMLGYEDLDVFAFTVGVRGQF